ncbi:MAG: M48 family metalloprotease [Phycisphaerales bacterium]
MPQFTRRLTRSLAAVALLVGSTMLGACTTNAATGRTQLNLLSRSEEIQIGQEAAPELIAAYGGRVPSDQLQSYVTDIGMKLAAQTEGENPSLPWSFIFLNSDVINAFALPGGQVFITRGLVERMDNEAQLAGVLGHEIAHVTARHANNRLVRQAGLSLAAAIGGVVIGSDEDLQLLVNGLVTGAGVYALTFDRGQESESDQLGMRYMAQAGYNPSAAGSDADPQERVVGTPPAGVAVHASAARDADRADPGAAQRGVPGRGEQPGQPALSRPVPEHHAAGPERPAARAGNDAPRCAVHRTVDRRAHRLRMPRPRAGQREVSGRAIKLSRAPSRRGRSVP